MVISPCETVLDLFCNRTLHVEQWIVWFNKCVDVCDWTWTSVKRSGNVMYTKTSFNSYLTFGNPDSMCSLTFSILEQVPFFGADGSKLQVVRDFFEKYVTCVVCDSSGEKMLPLRREPTDARKWWWAAIFGTELKRLMNCDGGQKLRVAPQHPYKSDVREKFVWLVKSALGCANTRGMLKV